jgi:hypothetical protein
VPRPAAARDTAVIGPRDPASTDTESTNRGIVTLVTEWFDELTRTFTKRR